MTEPPNRVPCSRCGWLVSPDAIECVICGQRDPGAYASDPTLSALVRLKHAWRRRWNNLLNRLRFSPRRPGSVPRSSSASYVNHIIVVCVILYALAIGLGILWTPSLMNLLTPSSLALYKLGMTGRLPVVRGRWWTLVTAIYLHGGLFHIAFNMLAVYQVGPLVERLFGSNRFFLIYTLSGVFGAFVSTLMGTVLTVGASGAIFGLMGAMIYYGHRIGELPRFLPILRWAAINFLLGMVTPQVDNWGHAGGFLGGILIAMVFMTYGNDRRIYHLYGRLAAIALIVTGTAFGLSLVMPTGLTQ